MRLAKRDLAPPDRSEELSVLKEGGGERAEHLSEEPRRGDERAEERLAEGKKERKIIMKSQPYYLAASLICADPLNLEAEIKKLEKGGADYLHFDLMDGRFVPRFGLYPEILTSLKKLTKIPVDVHLMVADPEPYLGELIQAGADIIVPHAESCQHLHRVIKKIKDQKVQAGVALNPATSLSALDYLLDDLDWVMLMAINPGIVGHKLIPNMLGKISELRQKIGGRAIKIAIDGGVTPESTPKMMAAGASVFVCGSSTIFRPQEAPVDQKLKEFKKQLDQFI